MEQTEDAESAFSGVAFHCYEGDVAQQNTFLNSFPDKEVYLTECTGVDGTDWWEDIKVSSPLASRSFMPV